MLRKLKLSRSDYQIGGAVQNEPVRRVNSGGMAGANNSAAPPVHPVVREVTEDTPPDLLEGTMDLLVVLPSKKNVRMTVNRRTPMMDLLIQVATANKIAPGGHIVQVRNERGIELPYKPSTPIGALDTTTIEIVPKNQVNEYIIVKKQTAKIANQPFEQTFRLQVHLPRNQLYVMRVGPKTLLEDILQEVCQEKNLDCSKYEIRHPEKLEEKLPLDRRIGDFGLQELTVVSRNSRINSSVSTADIMALQNDESLSKGCLIDSAFKHSRSSVGDSSVSSESAASARGISPSRSDDSRSISPLPPVRPKMKLNTTMSNASSSSGTSSSVPRIQAQQQQQLAKSPVEPPPRTKKRAAPPPPVAPSTNSANNAAISASQAEGLNRVVDSKPPIKPTPRKKEPPKDPPGRNKSTTLPIHHSRHSSDSSGYHEACEPNHHHHHDNLHRLDRQKSVPAINVTSALATSQRVTGSVSVTNLTTVSSISSTSLASSNGGYARKRKAPKPPSVPVLHAPKELDEETSAAAGTIEEAKGRISESAPSLVSASAPPLVRADTVEEEVRLEEEEEVRGSGTVEVSVDLGEPKQVHQVKQLVEEPSLPESSVESASSSASSYSETSPSTTSSSPLPSEESSVPSSQQDVHETGKSESPPSVVMDPSRAPLPVVSAVDSVVAVPPPRKPRTVPTSRPVEATSTTTTSDDPPQVKPRPKPRPRPNPPANLDIRSENNSNVNSHSNKPPPPPLSAYQPNRIGVKVLPDNIILEARLARLSQQVSDVTAAIPSNSEAHESPTTPTKSVRPSRKKYRAPDPTRSPSSASLTSLSSTVVAATVTALDSGSNDTKMNVNVQGIMTTPSESVTAAGSQGGQVSANLYENSVPSEATATTTTAAAMKISQHTQLARKQVVMKKKRAAPVPRSLPISSKYGLSRDADDEEDHDLMRGNGRTEEKMAVDGGITSPETDTSPPGLDFTRTSSDRHLVNKTKLFGRNTRMVENTNKSNSNLNRWQNFESLHDVSPNELSAHSPGTTTKSKHRSDHKHPVLLAAASKNLTTSTSSSEFDDLEEETQEEKRATVNEHESEDESCTDSGLPVTEDLATSSPDVGITEQLKKDPQSVASSRRSSVVATPENEAALRELLQAKLESEQEIIDKAFEGIELQDDDRVKSPADEEGVANENFDLAPSPALTKALESMTPSPMPVTDHTTDDDRALTPSSEEEAQPVREPQELFILKTARKISKSESFSHNSELDAARKRRLFSKEGGKPKKTYISSSDEETVESERVGASRTESMQNLYRNISGEEEKIVKRRVHRQQQSIRSESFRKTASVLNMQDIDPAIAQNPELMAAFQNELQAQIEQWKAQFLQKHGRLPSSDKDDSEEKHSKVEADLEANGNVLDEQPDSPVSNVKQVVQVQAQVHQSSDVSSEETALDSTKSVEELDIQGVVTTETVQQPVEQVKSEVPEEVATGKEESGCQELEEPSEAGVEAEPEKVEQPSVVEPEVEELPQVVSEQPTKEVEVPQVVSEQPTKEVEVRQVNEEATQVQAVNPPKQEVQELIQAPELKSVVDEVIEEAQAQVTERVATNEEEPKVVEADTHPQSIETEQITSETKETESAEEGDQVIPMPVNKQDEGVEHHKKIEEEEPQKIYRYSGPPTIQMATWGERPQRSVSVKRDKDYIMGFGQNNGSVAARVSAFAENSSVPTKPPVPRTSVTTVTPSVPPKPAVELREAATLPSVLSSWKQKMEQNRKSGPQTSSVAQVEIISNETPPRSANSTLERVKKSFEEQSSNSASPPPLSRAYGAEIRRSGLKSVDDTDAASDYSSSSSRPHSSLSRAPSNASISNNMSISDSASSSPVPPTSSLSDRRKVFQGVKPMESSKEKPIPAQNLKGNIATIQKVFEQQQQQQQQQQQALRNSRAGSVSSIGSMSSSNESSPAPSITGSGSSSVSSVAMMQRVLRGGSVNLDAFRRTPSPSSVSSLSSTSVRSSSEESRQASPLPPSDIVSTNTSRVIIESKPKLAPEIKSGIKNSDNRSIIIVTSDDTIDGNPYRQKLRVTAAPEPAKKDTSRPNEILQATNALKKVPSTPVITTATAAAPVVDIPSNTGKVSSIAATLKSSNNGFFSSLQRAAKDKQPVVAQKSSPPSQSTSKPVIIDEVEKPRKTSAVRAPESTSAVSNGVRKDAGVIPPPPPPMMEGVQLRPVGVANRPKTLSMSQSASKSPSNTPTSPDARSEILDAIKNSNGNFRLRKTGSSLLLR